MRENSCLGSDELWFLRAILKAKNKGKNCQTQVPYNGYTDPYLIAKTHDSQCKT